MKIKLGEISWSEEQTSLTQRTLDNDKEVLTILLLPHLLLLDVRGQDVLRIHDVGDLLFVPQIEKLVLEFDEMSRIDIL